MFTEHWLCARRRATCVTCMTSLNSHEGIDYPHDSCFYKGGNWGSEKFMGFMRERSRTWAPVCLMPKLQLVSSSSTAFCGVSSLSLRHHGVAGWSLRGRKDHRGHQPASILLALRRIRKSAVSNHWPSAEWAPPFCHWCLTRSSRTRMGSSPRQRGAQKLAPDHLWQMHTALGPRDKGTCPRE